MQFNGEKYGYVVNLQGDVVSLIDNTGTEVVKYVYDAWGKILSTTGSLASTLGTIQPFRYRSYVYDPETGLYYLRSRYYASQTSRFVNSDSIIGSLFALLKQNQFSYCRNTPIKFLDPSGLESQPAMPSNEENFWVQVIKLFERLFTVQYDVPLYNQESYALCWAFCQVMVEDFRAGTKKSAEEAKACAIELAKTVNGEENFNVGNWPTNATDKFAQAGKEPPLMVELYAALVTYGPIYAYYVGEAGGHLVVITGIDVVNNHIYTNNPWNIRGDQSYSEFLHGFAGMPEDWNMPFCFVIFPDK